MFLGSGGGKGAGGTPWFPGMSIAEARENDKAGEADGFSSTVGIFCICAVTVDFSSGCDLWKVLGSGSSAVGTASGWAGGVRGKRGLGVGGTGGGVVGM